MRLHLLKITAILLAACLLVSCAGEKQNEPLHTVIPFGEANTRGNTNGNIANLGLAAYQGGWIVFTDMGDGGKLKASSDGGRECVTLMEDLNDAFACINLRGGRIDYVSSCYSDINTADIDSETAQPLIDAHSYCLLCDESGIYYIDESGDGGVYRADGSGGKTRIGSHAAYVKDVTDKDSHASFSLDGGYLYYCAADENMKIYRVDLETLDETCVFGDTARMLIVEDGRVYFLDAERRLCRLKDNNTAEIIVGSTVGTFNVDADFIYYTDTSQPSSPVYRLDGALVQNFAIHNVKNTVYISLLNEYVMYYCIDPVTGEESTYFSKTDGSDLRAAG